MVLIWLAIIATSFIWNYQYAKNSVLGLARVQAKSTFDKDILYRRWNAGNGGVYVVATEKTPPNPHLADLAERDVISTSGKKLTLINPAYMTRQVHELGAKAGGVQGHITSLKPIRPENEPDDWERMALLSFEQGVDEKVELIVNGNNTVLRFMRPLVTEEACLKCHAGQGYKIGNVRGGISVSVPFGPFQQILKGQQEGILLGHSVIGLLGFIGIWIGGRRLCQFQKNLTDSLQKTRQLADKNQLLLTSLGEGVYGTDNEGLCSFINPAALRMLGYEYEEVIGKNPHFLFHAHRINGEIYPPQECPVFNTLKDGQARNTEDAFISKEGKILQVSLIVTAMPDPNNKNESDGVIAAFRDITEHRSLTDRLKSILDTASDGIHIVDIQGNLVEFSQSFANMLGYTADEMKGMNVLDWETTTPLGESEPTIQQLINTQTTFETTHRRKDGSLLDVEINAKGVVLDGQAHLYASARDITERKQIENALQETKSHLSTVVNTIPDLIWLKDINGVYLACNQEFQSFFGATEQEILGKTDYEFVSRELANFFRKKDMEAITTNKLNVNEEEVTYKSDGRRVTLETRKVPILNTKGDIRGILGIGRDITERKKAEKTISEANKKLQEMAMQDGLTQVANRRCFDLKLEEEWRRMRRDQKMLSIIILDVDYFKFYNDTYGHQAGDVCLQTIAVNARSSLKRPGDLFARYGGEEFVAILPDSNSEGASTLAEQIRHRIYELNIPHDSSKICKYVTVSCGVASVIPTENTNPQVLLETADKALYEAKETGRNKVIARHL
jgi:diguanylate cyclase (GGDEF)-like protein/PAS domain S-box-containing protein